MINRVDAVIAAILLAACGYLYYVTTTFEEVSALFAQNITPEMFPRLLLWTIAGMALALPIEQYLRGDGGEVLDKDRKTPSRPIAYATAALLCGTVFVMQFFGTMTALVTVTAVLPVMWGERRWKLLIPYVLIFPTLVMLVFSGLLGVTFERGSLGLFPY